MEKRGEGIPKGMDMDAAARYGIADGVQALNVVRQRAAQWGVSPDRVGFMGFSAGAMVTSGALLQADAAARPRFAGDHLRCSLRSDAGHTEGAAADLHGLGAGRQPGSWPRGEFHDALLAAGHKPEVHVYSAGGHGFGLRKQGTPAITGSMRSITGWKRRV